MSKKNKDLAAQLAKVTAKAVNDDPHNEKKTAKKNVAKTPERPRILTEKKEQGSTRERKLGVHLSTSAVDALRQLELFLLMECGASGTNHSAAISIALEVAAADMKENKARITELYEGLLQHDGRRRKSA